MLIDYSPFYSRNKMQLVCFKMYLCLSERQSDRKKMTTCIHWFTSQVAAVAKAEPVRSQEFGSPLASETQLPGTLYTAFPGTSEGTWIRSRTVGTPASISASPCYWAYLFKVICQEMETMISISECGTNAIYLEGNTMAVFLSPCAVMTVSK